MNKFLLSRKIYINLNFFYALFVGGLIYTVSSPIIIEIGQKLGSNIGQTSLIFSFYFGGFISGSFLSSFIVRFLSKKRLLILFSFILAISSFSMFYVANYFYLIPVFYLIGLSIGFIESQTSIIVVDVNKGSEALYVNLSQVFFGIGAFVGPLIPVFLLKYKIDWKYSYLIAFFACVAGIIYLLFIDLSKYEIFILRKKIESKTGNSEKKSFIKAKIFDKTNKNINTFEEVKCKDYIKKINHFDENENSNEKPFDRVIKKNLAPKDKFVFLVLIFCMFFYVCAETGLAMWIPTFLRVSKFFNESLAGQTLSYFWFATVFGRIAIGLLTKKIKITILLQFIIFTSIICCLMGIFSNNTIITVILFILTGFFSAGIWPLIVSEGGLKYSIEKNFVISIIIVFGGFGGLFAPWLLGFILSKFNLFISFNLINLFFFLLLLLVFILYLFEKKYSYLNKKS